jgi:hypothetical protein
MYKKALTLAAFMAACSPAYAQQCITPDQAKEIKDRLSLEIVSKGKVPGGIVATYANPVTGQFVIVLESANVHCAVANGDGFQVYNWGQSL